MHVQGHDLIVTGAHRSGTSLLWLFLNRHPDIALMYEAGFLKTPPILTEFGNRKDWARRLDFWTGVFSRHGLDPGAFSSANTATEAFYAVTSDYGRRHGASIFGEKLPAYCTELPALARQLPEAKFVIVWRDPVEVVSSVERAASSRSGSTFQRNDRVCAVLRDIDRLLAGLRFLQQGNFPVKIVSLADLQTKPGDVLADICAFLQIQDFPGWNEPVDGESNPIPPTPNNEKVRSGTLMANAQPDPESLPTEYPDRLARWMQYWQKTYPEFLFLGKPLTSQTTQPSPGLLEWFSLRRADWKDSIKLWLFASCPLWLWQKYRNRSKSLSEN